MCALSLQLIVLYLFGGYLNPMISNWHFLIRIYSAACVDNTSETNNKG